MEGIKLKVTATNRYNDVQYTEDEEGLVTATDLNGEDTWAIRRPSEHCIAAVQARISTCQMVQIKGTPYLLSESAVPYSSTSRACTDALVLSYETTTGIHFLLLKLRGRDLWQHLSVIRTYTGKPVQDIVAGPTLLETVHSLLGLEVQQVQEVGMWKVQRNYNPIVELATYVYTTVYHMQIQVEDVMNVLRHCRAQGPVPAARDVTELKVVTCDSEKIDSLLLLPEAALRTLPSHYHGVFHGQHRETMNRLLGTPVERTIRYVKQLRVRPVLI